MTTIAKTLPALNLAEGILAQASELAGEKNGDVFHRALQLSGMTCPNCDYPQNAQSYEFLLQRYVSMRLSRHRALRRLYWVKDVLLPISSGSEQDLAEPSYHAYQSFVRI